MYFPIQLIVVCSMEALIGSRWGNIVECCLLDGGSGR